jgi:hypothetical protein
MIFIYDCSVNVEIPYVACIAWSAAVAALCHTL